MSEDEAKRKVCGLVARFLDRFHEAVDLGFVSEDEVTFRSEKDSDLFDAARESIGAEMAERSKRRPRHRPHLGVMP